MDSAVFACSKPSKMLQQVGALIIVLLHFSHTEDSCEANNDSLCHNTASADNPHLTEVIDWLKSLHEFKSEPFAQPMVAEAKPIIDIVFDCSVILEPVTKCEEVVEYENYSFQKYIIEYNNSDSPGFLNVA